MPSAPGERRSYPAGPDRHPAQQAFPPSSPPTLPLPVGELIPPGGPRRAARPSAARPDAGREQAVVTVVVITYNPGDSLDACLGSLRNALDVPYEVLVVDNASTDGAPAPATRRHGAELIEIGRNAGYGTAANIGASAATAPWLLVINPDTEFLPGSITELLAAAHRWPRAGVLGPALLTPEDELYPSARAIPSLSAGIGHALCVRWWPSNPWTRRYRREDKAPAEGPVGWLSGACMLFRTAAFASVGGFDENYFMYFEDLDLCERLTAAGWANVYVPSAAIRHVGGLATAQVPFEMTKAHHRSALRYLSRKYSSVGHFPLRLVLRVGLSVRLMIIDRSMRRRHHAGDS